MMDCPIKASEKHSNDFGVISLLYLTMTNLNTENWSV
jgi:hypothetical protein